MVINLTKTRGAGSFAHEWFHALDNYFQRQRTAPVGSNREDYYITYRPEKMMVKKGNPAYKLTEHQLKRYQKLHPDAGWYKEGTWVPDPDHPEGVRPVVERAFADLVQALDESPMRQRSQKLDKNATDGYWSRIIERAARSFENYVIYKMAENGYDNEYLANVKSWDDWQSSGKNNERYPYLRPDEIEPVKDAFDVLFSTIETRETDQGVAMYSRRKGGLYGRVAKYAQKVIRTKDNTLSPLEIGPVSKREADIILAETGVDVAGYKREWDVSGVLHAYKRHGKGSSRLKDNEIPLTPELFSLAVDALKSPDSIRLMDGENRNNNQVLERVKKLDDGTVVYLEEVRTKRKKLVISSLRVEKPSTNDALRPHSYARNGSGYVFNIEAADDFVNIPKSGSTKEQVENWLKRPLRRLGKWVDVQVVQSVSELGGNHPADVRGMYLDGKVYLVADNITRDDAKTVLAHEVVGHLGLETLLGKQGFDALVRQVNSLKRTGNKKVTAIIEDLKQSYVDDQGNYILDEKQEAREVLAHMAEKNPNFSLVPRIVAIIRKWLARHGLGSYDDAMLESLIVAAARHTETNYSGFKVENGSLVPAYMVAYHGSPHDHDRFSTDHIGTGEGAQAYGWGLYFAGKREVAEWYRDKLADNKDLNIKIGGNDVVWEENGAAFGDAYIPGNSEEYQFVLMPLNQGDDIADIKSRLSDAGETEALAFAEWIDEEGIETKGGKLYQVELAPKEDEYLLWDKPLSEQSEKVQQIISKQSGFFMDDDYGLQMRYGDYVDADITGNEWYRKLSMPTSGKGSQKAASEYLHSLGIRGIKYLDGSSRYAAQYTQADIDHANEVLANPDSWDVEEVRMAKKVLEGGDYNYVIFNDEDVSIQAKYSRKAALDSSQILALWKRKLSLMQERNRPSSFVASVKAPLILRDLDVLQEISLSKRKLATILSDHPDIPGSVIEELPVLLADPLVVYVRSERVGQGHGETNVVIEVETARLSMPEIMKP